ncbi:DUF222 domain-containing protein [Nocardioides coralli]|nr:DUF222 domain-containing protein [Nocardioides coralli]
MAITPLPNPTPPGVVGSACAEIDLLSGQFWAARDSGELVETVVELQRLKAKAAALEAELLTEIDARHTAKQDLGWGSTADWYTHTAGTSRRAGRRTVHHAAIMVTERTATHDALRAGAVSPAQAAIVLDACEQLPHAADVRDRGEAFLLDHAGRLNASDLHRAGRHLAAVIDPDRDERKAEQALDREDRAAHLGRFLTITDDGAGGVRLKGRGTTEDAAWLRAALLPLTKPVAAMDPVTCAEQPDPRDHGARCGTPSPSSPTTRSTPSGSPTATAPAPASPSRFPPTSSAAGPPGSGSARTAWTSPGLQCAGWRVMPT